MSPRKASALRGSEHELRDHLIATAERLIRELGTAHLTVRVIAREAGVADGVLYNHFDGKEELIAQAMLAHLASVERDLGELPAPGEVTVEANLRAYLAYGLDMHQAILPAFAGLVGQPAILVRFNKLADHHDHSWRHRLGGYLRAERDLGRLASDADVAAATAMLVGICHETVLSGLFGAEEPEPPPSIESVVRTVMNGIT